MDYNPESNPAVADEDEDMDEQTLASSPGQSQIDVLLRIAEPCNVCRRTGATCTPIAGNLMVCLNRRLNRMAVVLEKIRECANSADYGPSPTPSHDLTSSPLEATHTPPRYSPEPRKMPTAALWDPKTGEQIYSPPRKSPVGKQKGPNPSETPTAALWDTQTGKQICSPPRYSPEPRKMPTAALWNTKTGEQIYSPSRKSLVGKQNGPSPPKTPKAPITRDPPGPTFGTFWPSGKPTIRAQYPSNKPKVGSAQKGNEPVIDTQETNRKKSDDSQETEDIEGLIKDIQQPLEGSQLDTLEPDSKVSRDQAMVGSTHAAQKLALLNSPGKQKGQSTDQRAEPVRARRTTEELEAARNIGG